MPSKKAQAGLEYLMTYGWALVLIVTVAGVLFFVMAPPTNNFVCRSSDPTKIIVQHYNLPFDQTYFSTTGKYAWGYIFSYEELQGEMILQNATGGAITITRFDKNGSGAFCAFNPGNCLDYPTAECPTPNYKLFGPNKINGRANISAANPLIVEKGGAINLADFILAHYSLTPSCTFEKSNFPSTHIFRFDYTDQFGYQKTGEITCNGWPPRT